MGDFDIAEENRQERSDPAACQTKMIVGKVSDRLSKAANEPESCDCAGPVGIGGCSKKRWRMRAAGCDARRLPIAVNGSGPRTVDLQTVGR